MFRSFVFMIPDGGSSGDGAAAGTTSTGQQGQPAVPATSAPAEPAAQPEAKPEFKAPAYFPQFNPDKRGSEDYAKYLGDKATITDVADAYVALAKNADKSLAIPGPEATREEQIAFLSKLGVPETADGYEIADEAQKKMLAPEFHKMGLTKGQASPTTALGTTTVAQTLGVMLEPFNPMAAAVALDCSFVARTFVGDQDHLVSTMRAAMHHHGFSLVDVLQQCVTFNRVNTFGWYKERVQSLPDDYDPTDREAAFKTALEWGDHIPIGVLYTHERPSYEDLHPVLDDQPPLWQRWNTDMAAYTPLLDELA